MRLRAEPSRALPVVVTTLGSAGAGPLVEGTELSRTLAGFAHMVALDTTAATFDLTDRWAGNCRVRPRRPALLAGLGPLR